MPSPLRSWAATPRHEVFCRGANFLIDKPVSRERARKPQCRPRPDSAGGANRTTIPVDAQALLDFPGKDKAAATLLELSETGLALRTKDRLPPACKAYLQFSLEGGESAIRLWGEVMWQDLTGRVGIASRACHIRRGGSCTAGRTTHPSTEPGRHRPKSS
jgi:hypothetical protein